jgi:hypothetical protein
VCGILTMQYANLAEVWGSQQQQQPLAPRRKKSKKAAAAAAAAAAAEAASAATPMVEPICQLLKSSPPQPQPPNNAHENIMDAYMVEQTLAGAPYNTPSEQQSPYPTSERLVVPPTAAPPCGPATQQPLQPPHGIQEHDEPYYQYANYYANEVDRWMQAGGRHTIEAEEAQEADAEEAQEADADAEAQEADAYAYTEEAQEAERVAADMHQDIRVPAFDRQRRRRYSASATSAANLALADLALYVISGILLIFILEQFLRIGMALRQQQD